MAWTADELRTITRGRWIGGEADVRGSHLYCPCRKYLRWVRPGDVVVAASREWGPHFSGDLDALGTFRDAGAVAAIVDVMPERTPLDLPLLRVASTRDALTALATAARERTRGKFVAVTGSVGKTSTVAMLQHVLARQGPTHATEDGANMTWGVALTVAQTPRDASHAIVELCHGEMRAKSELVRPHVAIVTEIALTHLTAMPSLAAVACEKAQVMDGLQPGGVAILNRDSAMFDGLVAAARSRGIDRVLTFGVGGRADIALVDASTSGEGTTVVARVHGRDLRYVLRVPGVHMARNSLAVLGAVGALGADVEKAAADLADFAAVAGRLDMVTITVEGGSIRLIDDTFNASPSSVGACLAVLHDAAVTRGGRRMAVLGAMADLGGQSARLHAGLAGSVVAAGVDRLYTVGSDMLHLRDALPTHVLAEHSATADEIIPALRSALRPGDIVAIKGSQSTRMVRVADAIRRLDVTMAATPPDH